ncbi:MAG: YjbH domain-containing protein, partial [Rhodospirillaceae bacterium]
ATSLCQRAGRYPPSWYLLSGATLELPRLRPENLPGPTPSAVVGGSRAIAWLEPDRGIGDAYPPGQVVGRALRRMAERAPPGLEEVTVVTGSRGLDGVAVSALASEVRRAGQGRGSAPEIRQSGRLEPGAAVSASAGLPGGWRPETAPPWRFRVLPRYQQSPWESLKPVVYRFGFDLESELEVTPGLIYSHTVRTTLRHNLDYLDASVIRALVPHRTAVRGDLALYVAAAPVNSLEQVAVTWLAQPSHEWTTRLAAGWFEEIYGGLSGEVLYRPWRRRWALGLEVDALQKRLPGATPFFEPHTGTVSAFASLYYQSAGGDIDGAVHVGRYLGGDTGSTFELGRRFDGGLRLAAWITGTTGADRLGVEVAQHRDRFDGGLRLSLPLGLLPLVPVASRVDLELLTLGRDSGQRAEVPLRLEPLTRASSYGAVSGSWARLLD